MYSTKYICCTYFDPTYGVVYSVRWYALFQLFAAVSMTFSLFRDVTHRSYLVTDVSKQHTSPTCKGQATDVSRNVGSQMPINSA